MAVTFAHNTYDKLSYDNSPEVVLPGHDVTVRDEALRRDGVGVRVVCGGAAADSWPGS